MKMERFGLAAPTSPTRPTEDEREQGLFSFNDYVDPLTFSDVYGSPSTYSEDHQQLYPGPGYQEQTVTRRVANAIFSPLSGTIFTIVAIPLLIAGFYWLFVVNGPTPVVKARIEEMPLQEPETEEPPFDWNKFL